MLTKYRAWDKKEKRMYPVDDIHWSLGGEIQGVKCALDEVNEHIIRKEDLVLLQFIGLKDRDGKEMYEGDIINTTIDYPLAQIVWCNMDEAHEPGEYDGWGDARFCAELLFDGKVDEEDPEFSLKKGNHIELCYYTSKETRVVGNIYQNPELLNKEE